jgi:hypothetical protein
MEFPRLHCTEIEVIMKRLLMTIFVLGFIGGWTLPILAEEDARAILEKAIKAQGAAERDKFKGARFKWKGTIYQKGLKIAYTDDELYEGHEKVRSAQELKWDGQGMKYVFGFDGKKAWMKDEDVPAGQDKSEVTFTAYLMNELYLSRVVGLTSLMKYIVKRGPAKDSEDPKAAPLIRALSDPSFEVREKASKDLLALGEPAVPSLEKALRGGDPEAARRAEHCLSVICSKDMYFDISTLPEVEVDGKPAQGVRVRSRGHRDINLYFDKKTNLMVKLTRLFDDPMSGEKANEERIIKEYQDVQGIKTIKKVETFLDGKKYGASDIKIEMEMIEAKYLDKVDDHEFAKPEKKKSEPETRSQKD